MKILLFADLDDTLFTSARKAPPGATHLPAAYLRDGSPISYASPAQQTLLAHWQAGAAKAEFEAQLNKSARLLFAAAEGMGNASVRPGFAQVAQNGIHSVARVEDDGQPVPARQLELLAEKRLLPFAPGRRGQRGREKIQPDFAHGHQPRIARMRLQGGGQLLRRAFARLRHVERMGAQRVSVAQPVRGLPGLIKRAGAHSGNHAAAHTQRAGLLTHSGQVSGELGRVQVAVGVNPARHGGAKRRTASGVKFRRHKQRKRFKGADFRCRSKPEAVRRKEPGFCDEGQAPKLWRRLDLQLLI